MLLGFLDSRSFLLPFLMLASSHVAIDALAELSSSNQLSAEDVVKPVLPKGYTFLVVKRQNCPHCDLWTEHVHNNWVNLGLNRIVPLESVSVLDAEKDEDLKNLYDLISKGKIREDVHSVPTFIVLGNDQKEILECRISGYKSSALFRKDLEHKISSCLQVIKK